MKKPPIITILGHVDHGKTTLLEFFLKTYSNFTKSIIDKEAGGITQKVRAFEISYKEQKLTFIDTPGHEAFMGLRDRGAQVADVAILIIAADEGVKPQTKESIDLLLAYKIPFVVALNKLDKSNIDSQKTKQQLSEFGVAVEDWGGDIPCVEISALNGFGIEELLEMLILVSDLKEKELKFDENTPAEGFILEAFKDSKKGILASAIIQNGTLRIGDFLATSSTYGKIKFFENSFGGRKETATASEPVIINGFNSLPIAGETFQVADEFSLKEIQKNLIAKEISVKQKFIISPKNDLPKDDKEGYNLIIRADHIGSLEALEQILQKLSTEKNIKLKILKADIGQITAEDLRFAKDTESIIISFNIKNQKEIAESIKQSEIQFLESEVIYELEENLKEVIEVKEKFGEIKGEFEVLAIFNKTQNKKTIGGEVKFGVLKNHNKILIKRGDEIVGKGKVINIEKNKNKVDLVDAGNLCGIIIETGADIETGDKIVVQ